MRAPSVSVIIPTLNRAHLLENTLRSLEFQDYRNFEVIVVNGPSEDATEDVLYKYGSRIKSVRCPKRNASMARNLGISLASGEICLFLDDDVVPWRTWITRMINGIGNRAVAFGGCSILTAEGKLADDIPYWFDRYGAKVDLQIDRRTFTVSGELNSKLFVGFATMACGVRRAELFDIGGFDEEFEYYLDDVDLFLRLYESGFAAKHCHDAAVQHLLAASDTRRPDGKLRRVYPVLKNALYFALKNTRENLSDSEARKWFCGQVKNIRERPKSFFGSNLELPASPAVLAEINRAIEDAEFRGFGARKKRPRAHIKAVPGRGSQFVPYLKKNPQRRKAICKVGKHDISELKDLVRAGYGVHVISCNKMTPSKMWFDSGVWFHQISHRRRLSGTIQLINEYDPISEIDGREE